MALIEVRPIPVKKWHGKEGKESFTSRKKIRALVDGVTRKYATGLSEADIKYLEGKGCKYDLSDDFVLGEPHPFWDIKTSEIALENNTLIFDTDRVLDYIKVKIMKASKFVANSKSDLDNGSYPEATHYIFSEQEDVEARATKAERRVQANKLLSKLNRERKIQIALILNKTNLKNKSESNLVVEMDDLVYTKTEDFIRLAEKDKSELALEALILESLLMNKLQKRGHKIQYGESVLGTTIPEVVHYLQQDENNELKLTLIAETTN